MPRRRLDLLAVNRQVYDLVVVVDERVDDGVFLDFAGQFIVGVKCKSFLVTKEKFRN